jgi:hypothetical protein
VLCHLVALTIIFASGNGVMADAVRLALTMPEAVHASTPPKSDKKAEDKKAETAKQAAEQKAKVDVQEKARAAEKAKADAQEKANAAEQKAKARTDQAGG